MRAFLYFSVAQCKGKFPDFKVLIVDIVILIVVICKMELLLYYC